MKRISKLVLMLIMFVSVSSLLACNCNGCGKPSLTSLTVKNVASSVIIEDELDLTNMEVIANYSDGSKKTLNKNDYTVENIDTTQKGEKILKVKHQDITENLGITVVGVRNIEVIGEAQKTLVNNEVDFSGIIAHVTFEDDSTRQVASSHLTFSTVDTSTVGNKTFTITYKQFTVGGLICKVIDIKDFKFLGMPVVEKNEEIDLTKIQEVRIVYTDDTEKEISLDDITFGTLSTQQSGLKDLSFTYEGKNYTTKVEVIEVTDIVLIGTIPTVDKGDKIDLTQLTGATLTFSNQTTETVSLDKLTFDLDNVDTDTVGSKSLKVTYKYKIIFVPIIVIEITNITLIGSIPSTEIEGGVDLTGVTGAIISYSNQSTKIVAKSDILFGSIDTTTSGVKKLSIQYKYFSTTVDVVVNEPDAIVITNMEVAGYAENIKLNGEFTTETLIADITYSDTTTKEITFEDMEIVGTVNTKEKGSYILQITYTDSEKQTSFTKNIVINVLAVKSIKLLGILNPVKIDKEINLDTITGAEVVYENENIIEVVTKDNLTFSSFDSSKVGNSNLEVSYNGYTQTVLVEVIGVSKITLNEEINEVRVGENLDLSSLISATITYGEDDNETVAVSELTFGTINTSTSGEKELHITYKNYTETIKINVIEIVSINLSIELDDVEIGESFDTSVITSVVVNYKNLTTKIVESTNLQITNIDTTTAGTKQLKITYLDFTQDIPVVVLGIKSLSLNGNLPAQILVGDEINVNDYFTNATLTYDNDTQKTLALTDLIIGSVDTSTSGEKNLVVSYKNKFTINISYEVEVFELIAFESPDSLSTYETNKTNTTSQTSFDIHDEIYVVGDDNAFILNPNITAIIGDNIDEIETITTSIDFEISSDNITYTTVSDITPYVDEIIYKNVNIDFNENAIDKYFKITVYAKIDESKSMGSFSLTFKVVDGYNGYSAKDLALIDNTQTEIWSEYKQSVSMTNVNAEALILHNNIQIKDSDIPTYFFYSQTEVEQSGLDSSIIGSIKDFEFIYYRTLNQGEEFIINGNYFTIDASQISLAEYNEDGYTSNTAITMHTSLLKFYGNGYGEENVNINNTSFKGNTQRSAEKIYSGGILLSKAEYINFNTYNTTFQQWFIGYMLEFSKNTIGIDNTKYEVIDYSDEYYTFVINNVTYYISKDNEKIYSDSALTNEVFTTSTIALTRNFSTLNHTKGFECYSSLLYVWGSQVNILNSTLKSAGGPVMIIDHAKIEDNNRSTGLGGRPSYVYCTDSELESLVTGEEPWFVTYGATALVAGMKSVNVYYNVYNQVISGLQAQQSQIVEGIMNAYACDEATATTIFNQKLAQMNSSFLKKNDDNVDVMNLIAVYKSGNAEGVTTDIVRGEFKIIQSANTNTKALNMSSDARKAVTADSNQGFVLENTVTGLVFDTKAQDMEYDVNTLTSFSTLDDLIKTYINIYLFNGMGVTVELFSYSA